MPPASFHKPEHLCRQRDIDALFTVGSRAATAYPLRAVFRVLKRSYGEPPVKVLISVAKRRLHHAVDRNRAKRQVREAYRLQKSLLLNVLPKDVAVHVGLLWLADTPVTTDIVMQRTATLLARIAEKIEATLAEATTSEENTEPTAAELPHTTL